MTTTRARGAYETRRTRILDSATALFLERDFDSVTVAEVADAASVTTKTVFNHFPRKEDLVFSGGDSYLLALAGALESRRPGAPITEPLHHALIHQIEASAEQVPILAQIARLTMTSVALQRRLTEDFDKLAQFIAAHLVRTHPELAAGGLAAALAVALVSVQRQVLTELGNSLAAGTPIGRAQADAYRAAAQGYDILRDGFGSVSF